MASPDRPAAAVPAHVSRRPSGSRGSRGSTGEPLPVWALAGGGFTLLAVALEVLGSVLGDSPSTSYPGSLTPFAWATPVRVVWWSAATVGAVAANRGLARVTGRRRATATILAALPFAAFTLGVAAGASWATWH